MADNFTPVQAQKFTLAGSGVSTNATSIILSSFKLPDGSTTITMSNFGDIGYGTLEPGTSREEQISFTGVTQNGDGTATLTGVTRGLRFVAPYDEVTANKKLHAGGAVFVLSNTAAFYAELGGKDNDETVTGLWTFTQFPEKSGTTTPTDADQFATKAYVDATATGSAVYDQNIVAGVAGETLAAGNLVYFKTSDGRWWLTDADTAATVDGVILGFAQGAATAGVAVNVVIGGVDKNQSGLTAGTTYYASNTAGALSSSAGTVERIVGKALTTTSIILNPNFAVIPTADEKEALVGSSGTPSSANKFITADDVAENTASKIIRRKSDSNITVPTTPTASTDAASKAYADSLTSLQAFTQFINLSQSTADRINGGASSTDGTVAYIVCNTSTQSYKLNRYALDTTTGQFHLTHNVDVNPFGTTINGASQYAGVTEIGNYVYVTISDGASTKTRRFDKADLLNGADCTYSGGSPTNANEKVSYTDGADLIVHSTGTTWKRYSISGTTLTAGADVTSITSPSSAWYDGSKVYFKEGNTTYRYTTTGTSEASDTRSVYAGDRVIWGVNTNSGAIYVVQGGLSASYSILSPIDKP